MPVPLPLRERVIVANVARMNAYQVAEAAHGAGYLRKFVTSIYYKPSLAPGAFDARAGGPSGGPLATAPRAPTLAASPRRQGRRHARGRAHRGGDAACWASGSGSTRARSTYLKNEVFDWAVARRHIEPCTIFHGWEQCALFSFRKARALGAITVLDQTQIHRTTLERIERDERARHGVPARGRQALLVRSARHPKVPRRWS